MITIGGQTLRQVDDLAPKTQTMLALIDGAERWLSWAIPVGTSFFRFLDEAALIVGIQRGLHGDAQMLLQRLRVLVHARKLWTLTVEQLNQILSYEGDDEDNEVLATSLQSVLNDNGIFTQPSLASGLQFLSQIGKAQSPVFQTLSLSDQIALMELVKTPPTSLALDRTAQADAATFAAESAQTPREFVDYYAFYFEVTERLALGDEAANTLASVRRVRDALLGPAQGVLACPVASGVPTTVDMYALVNQWVDQKQLIGFASIASALRQIAVSGPLPGAATDDQTLHTRLLSFVDGIQQFLKQTEPSTRTLSQDGLTYSYAVTSKASTARLDRQQDGSVTLGAYEPVTGDASSPSAGPPASATPSPSATPPSNPAPSSTKTKSK